MSPGQLPPADTDAPILGAAYIAAVLAGDIDMVAAYRRAFDAAQLLDAIDSQVLVMGRRIAIDSGRSLTEIGDDFVAAAGVLQRLARGANAAD